MSQTIITIQPLYQFLLNQSVVYLHQDPHPLTIIDVILPMVQCLLVGVLWRALTLSCLSLTLGQHHVKGQATIGLCRICRGADPPVHKATTAAVVPAPLTVVKEVFAPVQYPDPALTPLRILVHQTRHRENHCPSRIER